MLGMFCIELSLLSHRYFLKIATFGEYVWDMKLHTGRAHNCHFITECNKYLKLNTVLKKKILCLIEYYSGYISKIW